MIVTLACLLLGLSFLGVAWLRERPPRCPELAEAEPEIVPAYLPVGEVDDDAMRRDRQIAHHRRAYVRGEIELDEFESRVGRLMEGERVIPFSTWGPLRRFDMYEAAREPDDG